MHFICGIQTLQFLLPSCNLGASIPALTGEQTKYKPLPCVWNEFLLNCFAPDAQFVVPHVLFIRNELVSKHFYIKGNHSKCQMVCECRE